MLGEGPMPQTWKAFVLWALSPYRVWLLIYNVALLVFVLSSSELTHSWVFAVLVGLVMLWVLERVRE